MKQKMDISSENKEMPGRNNPGPEPRKTPPLPLNLPLRPFSPWLRLAHIIRTEPAESSEVARKRKLLDFELVLQCEGTAWIWVESLGGSLDVGAGSIVFIPPDFVHSWSNLAGTHIAVHFDLHFQPGIKAYQNLRMLDEIVNRQPVEIMPSFRLGSNPGNSASSSLVLPLVTPLRQPKQMRERLEKLIQIYQTQTQLEFSAQLLTNEVICGALATIAEDAAFSGFSAGSKIEQHIMALLTGLTVSKPAQLSSADLAEKCGMSQTAFRQAFQKVTGRNPHQYFEQLRIERAAQALLQTERSINSIARAEGYDDPYHFSRVFKRVMGASPNQFRLKGYTRDTFPPSSASVS
jgi:AraC-like DNA-binding protein